VAASVSPGRVDVEKEGYIELDEQGAKSGALVQGQPMVAREVSAGSRGRPSIDLLGSLRLGSDRHAACSPQG